MEIDIRIANHANEVLSSAGAWIKKTASDVGKAVSSWVKDEAVPWVEQAWADVKKFARDSMRAQQQADILSAQMTYHAACAIGDFVSANWKGWLNSFETAWSYVTWGTTGLELIGWIALPKSVSVGMWVVEGVFKLYHIGEDKKWW